MYLNRNAHQHRMMRLIVFIVACVLATPASAADDYLPRGLSGAVSSVIPAARIDHFAFEDEEGPDEPGCCPCLLCFQSLDETSAPLFRPPQYSTLEESPPLVAAVSPCVREIFHPPIR